MVKLTLEEVRAAALANNLNLKVQLINPTTAQLALDAERAKFESVFQASTNYARTGIGSGNASSSWAVQPSIVTPLQTGGTITTSLPVDGVDGVRDATASVSVVQSLLRGAGTEVTSYSIQIAGYDKGEVDALTKLQAIYILGGADVAYWRLYAARKQLAVNREQYKLAQNQLKYAHCKVEAGSAPKIEIVRAEAGLSGRLDAMISAETAVRDNEWNLKLIMNRPDLPLNLPVDINTVTDPDPKGLNLDQEALVKAALANRMELAELEFQLAQGDLDIALARNNLLPVLDLEYTYAAHGQAGNMGGAFDHLFREPAQDHQVGLTATHSFGQRGRRGPVPAGPSGEGPNGAEPAAEGAANPPGRLQCGGQPAAELAADSGGRAGRGRRGPGVPGGAVAVPAGPAHQHRSLDGGLQPRRVPKPSRISAFVDYEIAQVNLASATGHFAGPRAGAIAAGDPRRQVMARCSLPYSLGT